LLCLLRQRKTSPTLCKTRKTAMTRSHCSRFLMTLTSVKVLWTQLLSKLCASWPPWKSLFRYMSVLHSNRQELWQTPELIWGSLLCARLVYDDGLQTCQQLLHYNSSPDTSCKGGWEALANRESDIFHWLVANRHSLFHEHDQHRLLLWAAIVIISASYVGLWCYDRQCREYQLNSIPVKGNHSWG
jgi:hypothetical protein